MLQCYRRRGLKKARNTQTTPLSPNNPSSPHTYLAPSEYVCIYYLYLKSTHSTLNTHSSNTSHILQQKGDKFYMRTPKFQDPVELQKLVDSYFSQREESKEIRELKNGDKKIYKTPPTLYGLASHLGITYQCLTEYLNGDSEQYSKEIIDILTRTKQRIIEELLDGVSQGIWTEKIVMAMLTRMGVIGDSDSERTVKIVMQGTSDWSK